MRKLGPKTRHSSNTQIHTRSKSPRASSVVVSTRISKMPPNRATSNSHTSNVQAVDNLTTTERPKHPLLPRAVPKRANITRVPSAIATLRVATQTVSSGGITRAGNKCNRKKCSLRKMQVTTLIKANHSKSFKRLIPNRGFQPKAAVKTIYRHKNSTRDGDLHNSHTNRETTRITMQISLNMNEVSCTGAQAGRGTKNGVVISSISSLTCSRTMNKITTSAQQRTQTVAQLTTGTPSRVTNHTVKAIIRISTNLGVKNRSSRIIREVDKAAVTTEAMLISLSKTAKNQAKTIFTIRTQTAKPISSTKTTIRSAILSNKTRHRSITKANPADPTINKITIKR